MDHITSDETECITSIVEAIDTAIHRGKKNTLDLGNHHNRIQDRYLTRISNLVFNQLRINIPPQTSRRTIEFEEDEETQKRFRVSFVTISNIEVHTEKQNRGIFAKFISELNSILWTKYKRIILLESIIQSTWYDCLYGKNSWFKVYDNPTSLFYIPNIDEVKKEVGTSPWQGGI